ncbi:HNH endonuclease [Curtobacterium sp. NPDC098951]|uniref:HNH endonuclease n=1 Tax=Curtobacterium sp. NPDC098951 TaxID=3363974 RepID=UPI0037FC24C5
MITNARNTKQRDLDRAGLRKRGAACGICWHPLDYDLDCRGPRSFTANRIVPLARRGADTLVNKRAAHRECNRKKRARLIAPIVRRSAHLLAKSLYQAMF